MNRKIKQRDEALKEREEELRKTLGKDRDLLKNKVNRIAKAALVTGIISFVLYWIYSAFFSREDRNPEVKKEKKTSSSSFIDRIMKLIISFVTKALTSYFEASYLKKGKQD